MTWNQTLHGRGSARWDFLNPSSEVIDWKVVATVLARIPRFGGHTTQGVYSVAQHLVEGARAILRDTGRKDHAAAYLLHDVHETWIGDDVRPKIEALAELAGEAAPLGTGNAPKRWLKAAFRELKNRADAVIYPRAGLPWPLSPECATVVKEYDNRMLRTEADARTGPRVVPWSVLVETAEPVVGVDTSAWGEDLARSLWLGIARELLPALDPVVPVPSECECCEAPPLVPSVPLAVGEYYTESAPISQEAWDALGNKRFKPKEPKEPKEPIKDWCDWADGSRTPGTCSACGGVFGMLARPSVCKRFPTSVVAA